LGGLHLFGFSKSNSEIQTKLTELYYFNPILTNIPNPSEFCGFVSLGSDSQ